MHFLRANYPTAFAFVERLSTDAAFTTAFLDEAYNKAILVIENRLDKGLVADPKPREGFPPFKLPEPIPYYIHTEDMQLLHNFLVKENVEKDDATFLMGYFFDGIVNLCMNRLLPLLMSKRMPKPTDGAVAAALTGMFGKPPAKA